MKVKSLYISYENKYDVTFYSIFSKISVKLFLKRDYDYTKFGLVQTKGSEVTEGAISASC